MGSPVIIRLCLYLYILIIIIVSKKLINKKLGIIVARSKKVLKQAGV